MNRNESLSQELVLEGYVKMRHDISSSLSVLESSMKNVIGPNSDPTRAIRVHEAGIEKLKLVLSELDSIIEVLSKNSGKDEGIIN